MSDVPGGGREPSEEEMAAAVNRTADDLVAEARMRERLFAALAVVALVAAFVLTWLVSRSITRPLR